MGIFSKNKKENKNEVENRGLTTGLSTLFGVNYATASTTLNLEKSMQLPTVYRCVQVISESIASLNLEPYRRLKDGEIIDYAHPTYFCQNNSPNKIMNRFTFMKTLVSNILLKGNGYIYLLRDNDGNVKEQRLINPDDVEILFNTIKYTVSYKVKGIAKPIEAENMLHILNYSIDGFVGISTLQSAVSTLTISTAENNHAKGFFSNGANLSGILTVNGKVDGDKAGKIKTAWSEAFNSDTGSPNGIAVLEGNMSFNPVSISPADAQMLETRKFSVVEICRFFGVNPTKVFDNSTSAYGDVESGQLSFITDTLTPMIEKIEAEYNRKFYRPSERTYLSSKFDVTNILRADLRTQSEYYNKMFFIGAYTTNEVRRKIGNKVVEGGDKAFIQSSMLPIDTDFTPTNKQDNNSK